MIYNSIIIPITLSIEYFVTVGLYGYENNLVKILGVLAFMSYVVPVMIFMIIVSERMENKDVER